MDQGQIEGLIKDEFAFLLQQKAGWSLTAGPQDLELVAHALRVLLNTRTTPEFLADYLALVNCQNADGGWSPFSADEESTVWVSAFCGLMLIRGNRLLENDQVRQSVSRAIDYFLAGQKPDGRWVDPRWADLDTTSHPVSFFNVVRALGETHRWEDVARSWQKGLRFILDNQNPDGGWSDQDFHPSGVEITAHLIQDALIADLVMGNTVVGVKASCSKGLAKLREWQAPQGWWDNENVDHTMDCTRSSLVVARILGDDRSQESIEQGLRWIVSVKNKHGWGDFPGRATNLERTCDGVDTLLKYQAYRSSDPQEVIRLWGYVP
jgi:squalene cyclase